MFHEVHLTDEDLLLTIDDELPRHRETDVRVHLARCAACRGRYSQLEETAAELGELYRRDEHPAASVTAARAALESRLKGGADEWRRARHASVLPALPTVRRSIFSAAGATATVLVAVAIVSWGLTAWMRTAGFEPGALPVASLTPGATVSLSLDVICNGGVEEPAVIPVSVRQEVLRAYGMESVSADEYELDYLITPRLGGATTARNLWPQRYRARTWNAYIKDQLEDLLPRMVCAREVDLETAQRDIAADWIAAYRKYFKTADPLSHWAGNLTDASESKDN